MNELPSNEPSELGIPDSEKNRSLLRVFIDKNKKAAVYNDHGETGELLAGLATKYRLNLRVIDVSGVQNVEEMQDLLGFYPASGVYDSQALERKKPGFVINGLDSLILGNPTRFPRFRDLDLAMQPLSLVAQKGEGIMVVTHPYDYDAYHATISDEIHKVVLGSHWLSEFLYRRFTPKIIE